jgi:uncharacterized protein YecT (DUF1311 family)
MRVALLALTIMLMPVAARAGIDVVATCYQICADSTHSNPEFKACVARAADKADQLLNESYKKLQDAVRADAKDMGQTPDVQLGYLKDAQKQWIAYRDATAPSRTASLSVGRRSAAITHRVSAHSPTAALTTSSASRSRSWDLPSAGAPGANGRLKPWKNLVY